MRKAFRCAEEDSNLHPVSLDQALNLVTRVSYPSNASRSSRSSSGVDDRDVMDDLDVATDVATSRTQRSEARVAEPAQSVALAARGSAVTGGATAPDGRKRRRHY
jgi:hypothetical protein